MTHFPSELSYFVPIGSYLMSICPLTHITLFHGVMILSSGFPATASCPELYFLVGNTLRKHMIEAVGFPDWRSLHLFAMQVDVATHPPQMQPSLLAGRVRLECQPKGLETHRHDENPGIRIDTYDHR